METCTPFKQSKKMLSTNIFDDYDFYIEAHRGCVSGGLIAAISMANATRGQILFILSMRCQY